jgi:hypothetical protein
MNRTLALVVVLLAGCGGGGSSASNDTTGTETSGDEASASGMDTCVAFFTRQRECREEFLPGLVALRVRLDQPPGIAARDAQEHDALLAEAGTEFDSDSSDESIQANCEGIMAEPDAAQAAEGFGACLQQAECSGFVPCDLAMLEHHMTSQ